MSCGCQQLLALNAITRARFVYHQKTPVMSSDDAYFSCDESPTPEPPPATPASTYVDLASLKSPASDEGDSAASAASAAVTVAAAPHGNKKKKKKKKPLATTVTAVVAVTIQRVVRGTLVRRVVNPKMHAHAFHCSEPCCNKLVALNKAQVDALHRIDRRATRCLQCDRKARVRESKAQRTERAPLPHTVLPDARKPRPMPQSLDGVLLVSPSGWCSLACANCNVPWVLSPKQHTVLATNRALYPPRLCRRCSQNGVNVTTPKYVWVECRTCACVERHGARFFLRAGANRIWHRAWQCQDCRSTRAIVTVQAHWRRRQAVCEANAARLAHSRAVAYQLWVCRRQVAVTSLQVCVRRWLSRRRRWRTATPAMSVLRPDAPVFLTLAQQQQRVATLVRSALREELERHRQVEYQRYVQHVQQYQCEQYRVFVETERQWRVREVSAMHESPSFHTDFPPLGEK